MREVSNLAERRGGAARASRKFDRLFILELARVLRISKRRIKKDKCGDWNVVARRGLIATDGVSFYAYLRLGSPRRWKAAKRALGFLSVTQDGDYEGIFLIRGMPTTEQAASIRKVLGLRKAPLLTLQQRSFRRLNFASNSGAVSSEIVGVGRSPGTNPTTNSKMKKIEPTAKNHAG
jgi:hypothetical protein